MATEAPVLWTARARWARASSGDRPPDLSLEGSLRDLDLVSVRWAEVLARGYFGGGEAWER